MTKLVCPKCKGFSELTVEVKVNYELNWIERENEFEIGKECDHHGFKSFDDDSEVSCGCGWTGEFRRLVPATKNIVSYCCSTSTQKNAALSKIGTGKTCST